MKVLMKFKVGDEVAFLSKELSLYGKRCVIKAISLVGPNGTIYDLGSFYVHENEIEFWKIFNSPLWKALE